MTAVAFALSCAVAVHQPIAVAVILLILCIL